jgi:hypothetical protein
MHNRQIPHASRTKNRRRNEKAILEGYDETGCLYEMEEEGKIAIDKVSYLQILHNQVGFNE